MNESKLQTDSVLQRILEAVEGRKRLRWVEICGAIVLSLSALGSA